MMQKIEADSRHFSDFGWLKTYWLFSFSDYYDAQNTHFGALRVFNDDVVAPGSGFPMHSHHDMEGELEIEGHKFGTANQARIEPQGPVEFGGPSRVKFVLIDVPAGS